MANWIKALLILSGMCVVVILLDTAWDVFDAALTAPLAAPRRHQHDVGGAQR
ncbi:hypothetical protein [Streptomyces sp. NPDC023588]|uniref:hypothetical protein n=1 Tax=Streptomyces sp. NPDC023588 TaxID=3154907 RepID=UPI0033F87B32